jgi:hydroxyacylglutathione hydrolase
LITHKHNDHIGGVKELLAHYPVPVFGSKTENIPLITHFVSENEIISIPNWPNIHVIEVPGHTLGHVAYLVGNNLFCGDTLFGAGCGRLFEGTPAQMFESLSKINALPEDTLVYCAHEYTLKNLTFALKVDPTNEMIAKRISETETLLAQGKPSVPFTLKIEKETNPFLRCENPAIQQTIENHIGQQLNNDEVMVFKNMREWRNVW